MILSGALCVALAAPASATQLENRKIPVNAHGCTLCHATPEATFSSLPSGDPAVLTNFGEQWLQLGSTPSERSWSVIAAMNADNDGCSNGYELGDTTGSYGGRDDDPVDPVATGDPNNPNDCTLPLDEQSWGTLKQLFGSD